MSALGSDYILAALGGPVIGVYSLTTAQLVAELSLPLSPRVLKRPVRLLRLQWFTMTGRYGIAMVRVLGRRERPVPYWGSSMLAVAVAEPVGCVETFAVRASCPHVWCVL